MVKEVLIENLTWPEFEKRVKECDIAILCIGSVEEHGSHLPLGTDTFDVYEKNIINWVLKSPILYKNDTINPLIELLYTIPKSRKFIQRIKEWLRSNPLINNLISIIESKRISYGWKSKTT